MRTWSDSPFNRQVPSSELNVGRILSENDGESRMVYEIEGRPGWLAKIYTRPLGPDDAAALTRLIALPAQMTVTNRSCVDDRIAWPVAAIVENQRTVGIVMAKAPARFEAALRKFSGGVEAPKPLPLDLLVQSDQAIAKRGIVPPTFAARVRVVINMLLVGIAFEESDVVYADWSYRNAFWDPTSGDVFVIDMDAGRFHEHPWICSPEWEDPLFTDSSKPLTVESDRYKLAVLAVRCLSGVRRDPLAAHAALEAATGRNLFTFGLWLVLTAKEPESRLGPYDLLASYQVWQRASAAAAAAPPNSDGPGGAASGPDGTDGAATPVTTPVTPAAPGNVVGSIDLSDRKKRFRKATFAADRPTIAPALQSATGAAQAWASLLRWCLGYTPSPRS